ncbi:IQ domain-containing protein C isoform X2 [Sorex araneus]|uniref:IQ domain-containing protein C isoform X2 n=1 Tax=Sorex araneus TaxID=42254 RepID=UPI00243371BF|nr:IQ domain-containing protein C isoform X2 [Sorex araneus]
MGRGAPGRNKTRNESKHGSMMSSLAPVRLDSTEGPQSPARACVRGFLVRRHFQSLRAEYEAIVREIDGDLGTLQWTEGWIPTPRFPPQKAKSPCIRPAGERANPEQSRWLCKKPEKEAIGEKTRPTVSGESSASARRVPCPDARPWPQGQSRKPCREESADELWMKKPETAGPGLSYSQTELQELRSHLAMELLWLQQAINSRKEYLILKQTLRSPEACQTRGKSSGHPDHEGQVYESPTREDQSSSNRTTGERDHTEDACWGLRPYKSPERWATTDRSTVGSRPRDPGQRKTGPLLPTPPKNLAREPGHGKQNLGGTCQPLRNSLEDLTPRGLCSEKARTHPPAVSEDPHIKDKFPGALDHKESDFQRARPQEPGLSDDCVSWDEPLAGLPEHGGLDLWDTKPPKVQTLGDKSTDNRAINMASHEGWRNQRGAPWRASPPEKRSPAA